MNTTRRLKALMRAHDITNVQLADKLGITPPTLRSRFNDGNWRCEEYAILIEVLEIENPGDIFFKPNVSQNETSIGA